MPFSSGVFSLVSGNPVVTGTTISSTTNNSTNSDIATGLSTCLLKDGTQTATAAIPFVTGVTTTSTTFAVFNTTATTINAFGGTSTALNIGNAAGANTVSGVGTTFSGTTDATTTATGTIITNGGVGIAKALWVGGLANITGAVTLGSTINKVTITAPASAATLTLATGSSLITSGANSLTLTTTGATNVTLPTSGTLSNGMTLGTPTATTSGASVEFTGIPAGTKRLTVNLLGVSTNGTSVLLIQIGPSGGVATTGYLASAAGANTGGVQASTPQTTGFGLSSVNGAGYLHRGSLIFTLENSSNNSWCCAGVLDVSGTQETHYVSGAISLSGALSRVKITTVGGTDTFDAGEWNIVTEA